MGTIIGASYYQFKYALRNRLRAKAPGSDWLYRHYVGKPFLDTEAANRLTAELITAGTPFMMGRFGAVELFNMRTAEFHLNGKRRRPASSSAPVPDFFRTTLRCCPALTRS